MMNVLFVVAEASPFIKTGGLADVAGSLPQALRSSRLDIRVVLPLYREIAEKYSDELTLIGEYKVHLGWREQYVGVKSLSLNSIRYYFIDNEFYFFRDNIYGEADDGERFTFYSKAICELPKYIGFIPDIIHTNDWHTALVNVLVKEYAYYDDTYKEVKTVLTIHNLKYQGVFDYMMLGEIVNLPDSYFHDEAFKYYDCLNFLKAGIVFADAVTTVSKTYAEEMKYSFYGEGLEGIIKKHEDKITGIVNGIDYTKYNPENDPTIHKNYNVDCSNCKKDNKIYLQGKFGLPINPDIPMISMVTRLEDMKGLELIAHIFDELVQEELQFVILGTGNKKYEDMFYYFQSRYPEKVAARICFNEVESHEIYSGSDIFLMPSIFEPCGLSQLIALRYGTVPVVREVGGLKDTIVPFNPLTGEGNGFTFHDYNAHDCLFAIKNALTYYQDKIIWNNIVKQGMKSINDWNKSSKEYIEIYNLVSNK